MNSLIVVTEQDFIAELQGAPGLVALFERVLDRHMSDCLLTDSSTLSDFLGGGVGAPSPAGLSYEAYLDAWDAWAMESVRREFGIELATTDTSLVVLAELLRQPRNALH